MNDVVPMCNHASYVSDFPEDVPIGATGEAAYDMNGLTVSFIHHRTGLQTDQ